MTDQENTLKKFLILLEQYEKIYNILDCGAELRKPRFKTKVILDTLFWSFNIPLDGAVMECFKKAIKQQIDEIRVYIGFIENKQPNNKE